MRRAARRAPGPRPLSPRGTLSFVGLPEQPADHPTSLERRAKLGGANRVSNGPRMALGALAHLRRLRRARRLESLAAESARLEAVLRALDRLDGPAGRRREEDAGVVLADVHARAGLDGHC